MPYLVRVGVGRNDVSFSTFSANTSYNILNRYNTGREHISWNDVVFGYDTSNSGLTNPQHLAENQRAYGPNGMITGTMRNLAIYSNLYHSSVNNTRVILGDNFYIDSNTDGVLRGMIRYNGQDGYVGIGMLFPNTLFGIDLSVIKDKIQNYL